MSKHWLNSTRKDPRTWYGHLFTLCQRVAQKRINIWRSCTFKILAAQLCSETAPQSPFSVWTDAPYGFRSLDWNVTRLFAQPPNVRRAGWFRPFGDGTKDRRALLSERLEQVTWFFAQKGAGQVKRQNWRKTVELKLTAKRGRKLIKQNN